MFHELDTHDIKDWHVHDGVGCGTRVPCVSRVVETKKSNFDVLTQIEMLSCSSGPGQECRLKTCRCEKFIVVWIGE